MGYIFPLFFLYQCSFFSYASQKSWKPPLKALLLLHVSVQMTNNNTAQCLAVVLGLAHISGILVRWGKHESQISAAGFIEACECYLK